MIKVIFRSKKIVTVPYIICKRKKKQNIIKWKINCDWIIMSLIYISINFSPFFHNHVHSQLDIIVLLFYWKSNYKCFQHGIVFYKLNHKLVVIISFSKLLVNLLKETIYSLFITWFLEILKNNINMYNNYCFI